MMDRLYQTYRFIQFVLRHRVHHVHIEVDGTSLPSGLRVKIRQDIYQPPCSCRIWTALLRWCLFLSCVWGTCPSWFCILLRLPWRQVFHGIRHGWHQRYKKRYVIHFVDSCVLEPYAAEIYVGVGTGYLSRTPSSMQLYILWFMVLAVWRLGLTLVPHSACVTSSILRTETSARYISTGASSTDTSCRL